MATISDVSWLHTSFLVSPANIEKINSNTIREYTTAGNKLHNGAFGTSLCVNPAPQYSVDTDITVPGLNFAREGAGRFWSEQEDSNQYVHFRFGVPKFNSLTSFFGFGSAGFYSPTASIIARTGGQPNLLQYAVAGLGFIVALPIKPFILIGDFWNYINKVSSSSFYSVEGTMHSYWSTVNNILNDILVTEGLIPEMRGDIENPEDGNNTKDAEGNVVGREEQDRNAIGKNEAYTQQDVESLTDAVNRAMGGGRGGSEDLGIFRKSGGIDVFNYSSRIAREAILARRTVDAISEGGLNVEDYIDEYVKKRGEAWGTGKDSSGSAINEAIKEHNSKGDTWKDENGEWSIRQAVLSFVDTVAGNTDDEESALAVDASGQPTTAQESPATGTTENNDQANKISNDVSHAQRSFESGGEFMTLRVDHTGTADESFQTTTGEAAISSTINGFASTAKATSFNLAGGNLAGGLGDILAAVKDTVGMAVEGAGMPGLASLGGGGFADIPLEVKDTSVTMPTMSYTVALRADAGDPITRALSLWLPFSCILAGAAGRSVGKHAHTTPYLCQVYDKGHAQSRTAVISSVSFKRGAGNNGWTQDDHPLGIDVTIEVTPLDNAINVPLTTSPKLFDSDSPYSDYINVLGSLTLEDQFYLGNRLNLSIHRRLRSLEKYTDSSFWWSKAGSSGIGNIVKAFSPDQALVRREGFQ